MAKTMTKGDLSPARRELVELLQKINFGRIEGLAIHDGDPVLSPAVAVVRDIKFGGENGPRPEVGVGDFTLKAQVVDLFAHLDQMDKGIIRSLEVKHGLPFRMTVRETHEGSNQPNQRTR